MKKKLMATVFFLACFAFSFFLNSGVTFSASNIVEVVNGHFVLNGKGYRFLGVNASDLLSPAITKTQRLTALEYLSKQCGVSVVRLVFENDSFKLREEALGQILEIGTKNNLRFIVSLGTISQDLKSKIAFYSGDLKTYQTTYLETVKKFKDQYSANLLAWELPNEPECPADQNEKERRRCQEMFVNFVKNFSQEIKKNDPEHLLFSGTANADESQENDAWQKIDALENHLRLKKDSDPNLVQNIIEKDILSANSKQKPFFVEELGIEDSDQRSKILEDTVNFTFDKGAEGFLLWNFALQESEENKTFSFFQPASFCQFFKRKANLLSKSQAIATQPKKQTSSAGGIILSPIPSPDMGWKDISSVVSALAKIALIISAIITFFQLILGGLRWIISGGDAKKTEAAGKQITNALIGLGIVAAAWAVMLILEKFFNINIISGPIILTLPQ